MKQYPPWKDPSRRLQLVAGLNRFGFRLFARLLTECPDQSLFFSPSSLSLVLAMVHAGAEGETRAELATLLELDDSLTEEEQRAVFRELAELAPSERSGLQSANRLWGEASYPFHDKYLREVREDFQANLQPVDFEHNAEAARLEINAWVEERTNRRIRDLVPPGAVTQESRLVLTNAAYFLGTWMSPFEEEDTRDAPFYTAKGDQRTVSMMFQELGFPYGETAELQTLCLPYESTLFNESHGWDERVSEMEMQVLLPRINCPIGMLTNRLAEHGESALPRQNGVIVKVYLPRFQIETTHSLSASVGQLGCPRMFARDADLSRIASDADGLFVTDIVQKAFVSVNEKGTEAAAATAALFGAGAGGPRRVFEFNANRPFLFYIKHKPSGLIHFIGHYAGPGTT